MSILLSIFILAIMIAFVALIQGGINYLMVRSLPLEYFSLYRYVSYVLVIFLVLIPIAFTLVAFVMLARSGTPDPGAMAVDGLRMIRDVSLALMMIVVQIIFNQIFLKRIALKRSEIKV